MPCLSLLLIETLLPHEMVFHFLLFEGKHTQMYSSTVFHFCYERKSLFNLASLLNVNKPSRKMKKLAFLQ